MDTTSQPTTFDAFNPSAVPNSLGAEIARLGASLLDPERELGVFDSLDEEDYFAIRAVSNSGLHPKDVRKPSMRHVACSLLGMRKKDSASKKFGKQAHRCLLEPERFSQEIAIGPEVTTKALKEWKEFVKENPHKTCLKPSEARELENMIEALLDHPVAASVIRGGVRERTVLTRCPRTGLIIKSRYDFDSTTDYLMDYKTAEDASLEAFEYNAARYGYPNQDDFYMYVAECAGLKREHFLFLVQEKDPPYAPNVFFYDSGVREKARELNMKRLDKVAACAKSGIWNGYPAEIVRLGAPDFYFAQEE